MNSRNASVARLGPRGRFAAVAAGLAFLAGCGGSGSTSSTPPSSTVNNTQAIQVNFGPGNYWGPNGPFTDVTVCVPGTSSCQDIPNVVIDTGSYGLRLLASQVTVALPQTTDSSGDLLQECVEFADLSYVWGPVATADIQIAGEKASGVPIQLISASDAFAPPSGAGSCTSGGGPNENTVEALGANGILGIGPFQQDCGTSCTGSSVPALYYICPSSGCELSSVPLANQLTNPVWAFPQDNNGVLISLPSVSASGAATLSGSMYFGIGTQSDNALGSASIYTTDANGNVGTTFNGTTYSGSFFDTGSNALLFLDSATLGIPDCSDSPLFYCPSSTVNYTATNTGANGTAGQISFSVANADMLFSTNNAVFNDLAGANPGAFDWGLPFFLGRNVFVGIEGQSSPTGVVGPYWAF
jgi:hypothetical protein